MYYGHMHAWPAYVLMYLTFHGTLQYVQYVCYNTSVKVMYVVIPVGEHYVPFLLYTDI